jgi:hypothetical protein
METLGMENCDLRAQIFGALLLGYFHYYFRELIIEIY